MNSKTAKAIRRELRAEGVDLNEARKYQPLVVQSLGSRSRVVPSTRVLSPESARGKYKAAKRAYDAS